ncbi:MAG: hypothetical protein Q7S45_02520 [Candidatus Curtissbacteria bacterium]|nr:hypothetical protein [Candidatus Curtissbacteria bacterium]
MIKIIKNTIRYMSPVLLLLTIPAIVMAQAPATLPGGNTTTITQTSGSIPIPTALSQTGDITVVIGGIIRFILVTAFVIAFIMLLVGGIRWILAGGDEKAVEKARNTITAALIGLVVVLVAFALIRLVELFFGVNIISGLTVPRISPLQTPL